MLDKEGFDGWADKYDEAVDGSMESGTYPFCGYDDVHGAVFELVKNSSRVLDLGIGTARLTKRLYDLGIEITGVDFSENMLDAARESCRVRRSSAPIFPSRRRSTAYRESSAR